MGGGKEPSTANYEVFELCKRGETERVRHWLSTKKSKRPRTPLSFLRSSSTPSGWLCAVREPATQYTPLHVAALHGRAEIARLLIDADPHLTTAKDGRGCIPLHLAAWSGHYNITVLLAEFEPECVDVVNNALESALHLAAQHGHVQVLGVLLDKHSDPRSRNVRGEAPLDIAARCGHAQVCKTLVNYCPELALQAAAECTDSPTLSMSPLSSSAPCPPPRTSSRKLVYPLHAAARGSHVMCMQILRLAGFDVDFVTDEGSALHVAALHGNVDAVRFLLREGINAHIKDSHGRTVLDALEEHENDRSSDLTQVMPAKEAWKDCRILIEEYMNSGRGTLNSSSDSGIDRREECRVYNNVTETRNGDQIWRPLPSNADAFSSIGRVNNVNGFIPSDIASTMSLSTSVEYAGSLRGPSPMHGATAFLLDGGVSQADRALPGTLVTRTWNTRQLSDAVTADGRPIPRFPLTSPMTKNRHNSSKRGSDTLPPKIAVARTVNGPQARGTILPGEGCVYRAPPSYDSWAQPSGMSERVRTPVEAASTLNRQLPPPSFPYDNVPKTLSAYDNAPGQRRWEHNCAIPSSSLGQSRGSATVSSQVAKRSDGTQTLPTGVSRTPQRSRPSVMTAFRAIEEDPSTSTQQQSTHVPTRGKARKVINSREDSLGLSSSPTFTRAGRRSSNVTFTCSTLERSMSPVVSNQRGMEGRAPLAVPEELTGSTSASLISASASPERHILHRGHKLDSPPSVHEESITEMNDERSGTETLGDGRRRESSSCEMATESHGSSRDEPTPSPTTSAGLISDALCAAVNNTSLRQPDQSPQRNGYGRMSSPSATECSDGTIASSCSLPLISQRSVSPPSTSSPRRMDDTSRLRKEPGSKSHSEKVMHNAEDMPLDESAEWRKIDNIIQSFGAGIDRGSSSEGTSNGVRLREYAPRVASFLRERHSQALTLQLSSPSRAALRPNQPSEMNQRQVDDINRWLRDEVGLSPRHAASVSLLLQRNGFDRVEYMHGSLDRLALVQMGIADDLLRQICSYLESRPMPVNSATANDFDYVSDWLGSLDLKDYLGCFVKSGLKSMLLVRSTEIDASRLNEIGIMRLGHVLRILFSIRTARKEEQRLLAARAASVSREKASRAKIGSPTKRRRPASITEQLITGWVTFSAHYLGSTEVSNVNTTEEARAAMARLKKAIREIAKVPQMRLEVSVSGVRISDSISGLQMAFHEIYLIQIVCQDERDLNCFTYITRDHDRFLCHVFCVLTADVATEIVITLGQAFESAFQLQQQQQAAEFDIPTPADTSDSAPEYVETMNC